MLTLSAKLIFDTKQFVDGGKVTIKVTEGMDDALGQLAKSGALAESGLGKAEDGAEGLSDANEELKDKTDQSAKSVDNLNKKAEQSATAAGKAIAKYTAMGIAIAVAVTHNFVSAASEAENYQLRLNRLLGSQAEGNRMFKDMAKFASAVPFAYQEIMASATTLAGVLKGGVDEVNQWMPLIADLAAVSGLSIEQTTDQVVKMFTAGAGSADLFKERGILAMLGFESGVTLSAAQTREKLIAAFEDPASKFKGAALDLAESWDGLMSMMGDKWFNTRTNIMDAGLFEYFKELATVLDETLGDGLQASEDNAVSWANSTISGIGHMIGAGANLLDMVDVIANAFSTLHSSALTLENIAINIQSLQLHADRLLTFDDNKLAFIDRMLAESQAALDTNAAQIAANNIEILERSNRDWSAIADGIIERAEAAAAGVQAANDAIEGDSAATSAAILAQQQAAAAAAAQLANERAEAVAEAYAKEVDAAQKKLDVVLRATDTEREKVTQWYRDSVKALDDAERLKLKTVEEVAALRLRLEEEHQKKITALDKKATAEAKKELDEQLKNSGLFGGDLTDLYTQWSDFWNDSQGKNTLASIDSFDDILDAFESFLKKMALRYLASGIDKLFGLGGDGGGFSFSGLLGGGNSGGGVSLGDLLGGGKNNSSSQTGSTPTGGNGIGSLLGLTDEQTKNVISGASSLLSLYNGFQQISNGNKVGGALQLASGGVGVFNAYSRLTGGAGLDNQYTQLLGGAGDIFGLYSGLRQGGVAGYGQAFLSGRNLYNSAQGLGLFGGGDVATAFNPGFTGQAVDIASNTATNTAAQTATNTGIGGAGLATNALGAVAIAGGLKSISDGLERGGRRGYSQAGAGALATYGGAAAISNGALAALGPYGWAAMAVLSLLSLGGGREWEQILQEDYLPDVLGNGQAGFSALGADGGIGFAGGGNTAVFGANYGIEGSGITEQFSADGGENGNYAFFTGAQQSLDGFEDALRAAGISDINNTAGTLSVTSSQHTVGKMQEIWRAYRESLDEAVPAAAVFATAVENGLIGVGSHAKLFFEEFAVGFGQNAFQARESLLQIDADFDALRASGMESTDALFQAIADHYKISIGDAQFFVEQTKVSTEQWVANFSDASGELLNEMLDFNAQGETAFEGLTASAAASAADIEHEFGGAFESIRNRMRGLNFDGLANLPVANGAPPIQSFDVGTPRVLSDGLANIHQDEMIIDARSANALRKYGVPAPSGGDSAQMQQFISSASAIVERLDRMLPHFDLVVANQAGFLPGAAA